MGTIKPETQLCTIGHSGFDLWPHATRIKNPSSWNPMLVTSWVIQLKAFFKKIPRRFQQVGQTTSTKTFDLWLQPPPVFAFEYIPTFIGSVGALGSPDGRVGRVWAVLIDLISSALVLLAYLCQVVHTEATQLLCDGSLTLSNTHTHTHITHIDFYDIFMTSQFRPLRNKLQHAQQLNTTSDCSHHLQTVWCCRLKNWTFKAVLCERRKSHD